MFEIVLFIGIKMDLALNNLQWLRCHKTKPTKVKCKWLCQGTELIPFPLMITIMLSTLQFLQTTQLWFWIQFFFSYISCPTKVRQLRLTYFVYMHMCLSVCLNEFLYHLLGHWFLFYFYHSIPWGFEIPPHTPMPNT